MELEPRPSGRQVGLGRSSQRLAPAACNASGRPATCRSWSLTGSLPVPVPGPCTEDVCDLSARSHVRKLCVRHGFEALVVQYSSCGGDCVAKVKSCLGQGSGFFCFFFYALAVASCCRVNLYTHFLI
uniref:Uncharacterized protein n=1 Tax=Zea mays TaxID=4577 RepID=A0A804R2S1_MAIZE